jgi:hypothetical protein
MKGRERDPKNTWKFFLKKWVGVGGGGYLYIDGSSYMHIKMKFKTYSELITAFEKLWDGGWERFF